MKRLFVWGVLGASLFLNTPFIAYCADMRAVAIEAREKKALLLEKARLEKEQAEKEAKKTRQKIFADKKSLMASATELKMKNRALKEKNVSAEEKLNELIDQEKELASQFEEMDAVVRELVGFIRINARDLDALLNQSLQKFFFQNRKKVLASVLKQARFPGMDDIHQIVDLTFDEIKQSGEVFVQHGPIVDRAGKERSADILFIGNFTAAYMLSDEIGFLINSDKSDRLFALSKFPPPRIRKKLRQYMAGESEDVPIDVSRGGALRQLTHRLDLLEQVPKGGAIVWPILGILFLAILIIVERFSYLFRMKVDADVLTNKVNTLVSQHDWKACRELCTRHESKPLPKVLLAGIKFRNMNREDMENAIQEKILHEIPRLEKFLSTLGMLGAIAPLLGLLGTVTGMIKTFHVITYYGTGDPRMMSGGISEALVTTMIGLAVAIPIMLCHTFLTRMVENIIGQMEEKSVSFINTVFKTRTGE